MIVNLEKSPILSVFKLFFNKIIKLKFYISNNYL